jgi:hypothetical protein
VPPEHGVASDDTQHVVGETVSVHCDAGFEPGGNSQKFHNAASLQLLMCNDDSADV